MLTSQMPVHVSSLVVRCLPGQMSSVLSQVNTIKNLQIHAPDNNGKFVVVMETDTEKDVLSTISDLEKLNGVLNATLIYHEIDYGENN